MTIKGPMPRHHCECGDHVWARANLGFVILLSPADEHFFDVHWCIGVSARRRRHVNAHRSVPSTEGYRNEALHRLVASAPDGTHVDHKNLNSLDNRRSNVRCCTPQQNMLNRPAYAGKIVPLKGVQLVKKTGRYKALIRFEGKLHYLGQGFRTAEDAHEAYLVKAKELHGDFFRATP